MKQSPKLSVVSTDRSQGGGAGGVAYEFVTPESLSTKDRERLEGQLREAGLSQKIIAVHRSKNGVSIRPVIVTDAVPEPSIVRFIGREVRGSNHLLARQQDYLMRLSDAEVSSGFDWGGKGELLWFSRPIYRNNLSDLLSEFQQLQPEQAVRLIQNLVQEVESLHRQGVVHGHINVSNVAVVETTADPLALALVDVGAGLISFQAGFNREHYRIDSFGPEVARGDQSVFSTDLYSTGLVMRTILARVDQTSREYDLIAPLILLSRRLTNNDPTERGTLREVTAETRSILSTLTAGNSAAESAQPTEQPVKLEQGKILSRRTTKQDELFDPRSEIAPPQIKRPVHVPFEESTSSIAPVEQQQPLTVSKNKSIDSRSNSSSSLLWLVMAVALAGLFYYRTQYVIVDEPIQIARDTSEQNSYSAAWLSFIPSRMLEVAERAVSSQPDQAATRKIAESVIVASVRAGDIPLTGANSTLIRTAFNEAWELELTADDRRAALALGLGGLLKGKFPTDLKPLDSLHPGVLLALVSTINDSESAREHLSDIPAAILTRLPAPYGIAFRKLIQEQPDITCGNQAVELLARIGVRGPTQDDLSKYLVENSEDRAQALAMITSRSSELSEKTLNILLSQPQLLSSIPWARAFKINEWVEVPASQKLLIAVGMIPSVSLSADRLGKLLGHPSPVIRGYAAGQLKELVHFEHPGAVVVLEKIRLNGAITTPEQLVGLARILAMKAPYDLQFLNRWMQLNPDPTIMSALLIATSKNKSASALDTALVAALQKSSWSADIEELRRLSQHPDRNARLYAFGQIYKLNDREVARDLLEFALGDEKDEQCRTSLTEMLNAL